MGRPRGDPTEFGLEKAMFEPERPQTSEVPKGRAGKFVQRTFKLVPLTECEQDAYSPGGPCSGQTMPKFKEVLVTERYFEGIG